VGVADARVGGQAEGISSGSPKSSTGSTVSHNDSTRFIRSARLPVSFASAITARNASSFADHAVGIGHLVQLVHDLVDLERPVERVDELAEPVGRVDIEHDAGRLALPFQLIFTAAARIPICLDSLRTLEAGAVLHDDGSDRVDQGRDLGPLIRRREPLEQR
jgi:hypothetical protein